MAIAAVWLSPYDRPKSQYIWGEIGSVKRAEQRVEYVCNGFQGCDGVGIKYGTWAWVDGGLVGFGEWDLC